VDLASGAYGAAMGIPEGRVPSLEELALELRIILKVVKKQFGGMKLKWQNL
jgi:hypothetical protein